MKKLLPILLSVVVVISILAGVALNSYATDADPVLYVSGDYTYTILGSTDAKIVGYSGADAEIVIPTSLDDYKVTFIDDFAFMQNTALKNVTIPHTVVSVGEYAFLETSLDYITFLNAECEIFDSEYTIESIAVIRGYDNSTAQLYAEKYDRVFESLGEVPEIPTVAPTVAPTAAPTDDVTEIPTTDVTEAPTSDVTQTPTEDVTVEPTNDVTEEPTQKPFVLGDVDGDGEVSVMDATAIQLHIASLQTIPEDKLPAADADRDGDVSVLDATAIQLLVARLIDSL